MTSTETAVSLMRMALALLEKAGDDDVASRLRGAIDAVGGQETLIASPIASFDTPRLQMGGSPV